MRVKRIGDHDLKLPVQQHIGDAGYDLSSTKNIPIWPGEQLLIPVGFAFEIPSDMVGFIKDRSSLASKYKLHISAGVIDSTYRGEVHVCIRNNGFKMYDIKKGDRIAQLVVIPCYHGALTELVSEADSLDDTARSDGGFGSTGK